MVFEHSFEIYTWMISLFYYSISKFILFNCSGYSAFSFSKHEWEKLMLFQFSHIQMNVQFCEPSELTFNVSDSLKSSISAFAQKHCFQLQFASIFFQSCRLKFIISFILLEKLKQWQRRKKTMKIYWWTTMMNAV